MRETWPIGTQKKLDDGTIIEVAEEIEEYSCEGCFFDCSILCQAPDSLCDCWPSLRDDHIGIIFKEVKQ